MSLQSLPPELIERIVVLLPLSDTGSLRLTSRCLASNATQRHFKTNFRTRRVQVIEQRLRSFVDVTASGGLGCLLRDLTLVAQVYNTSELAARLESGTARVATVNHDGQFLDLDIRFLTEKDLRQTRRDFVGLENQLVEQTEMSQSQRDVELLGQAFCNFAKHGASLRMLRTELEVYQDNTSTPLLPFFGGSWTPIWTSATELIHTLFASLSTSDLPVQGLDLFNSSRMLRCSIASNKLDSIDFAPGRLNSSLCHLTELSLSISDPMSNADGGSAGGLGLDGLRSLLGTCSSLQKLDLAHFALNQVPDTIDHSGRIISTLSRSYLPYLKHLTLQGFKVAADDLLALLRGLKSLRVLWLRFIRVTDGSFKPIVQYCTVEASMEEVELDALFEPTGIVLFEPPWVVQPSRSPSGMRIFPYSRASYRRASANEAGTHVKHHVYERRTVVSSIDKVWKQDLRNWFGPLPEDGKPSCLQPHVRPERTWRYR